MLGIVALLLAVLGAACALEEPHTAGSLEEDSAGNTLSYPADVLDLAGQGHIALEPVQRFGDASDGGLLYIPAYLDVADDGRVFVADNGNKNVVMFSADGAFLGSFSRTGQGPGEIEAARGIALAGNNVYVLADRNRAAVWTRDGRYLRDTRFPRPVALMTLTSTADGTLVSRYFRGADGSGRTSGPSEEMVIVGFTDDEENVFRVVREYVVGREGAVAGTTPLPEAYPIFAVGRRGRVYYSDAARYDITAADLDGSRQWRLRADIEAPLVTDEDIERAIRARRPGFEIARDSVDWPETFPTLLFLRVDGHGHVYVYRWVRSDPNASTFPIDVFAASGEHLYSGTIDRRQWLVGRGALVYGFEESARTGGVVAVAYRIVEPFVP